MRSCYHFSAAMLQSSLKSREINSGLLRVSIQEAETLKVVEGSTAPKDLGAALDEFQT